MVAHGGEYPTHEANARRYVAHAPVPPPKKNKSPHPYPKLTV